MNFLVYLLLAFIAIFPKVSIISIGGSSAGIRFEDFLIAIVVFLLIYGLRRSSVNFNTDLLKKIEKIFFTYIILSTVSTLYGIYRGYALPITSVLFLVRKVEYFVLIYVGFYFGNIVLEKKRQLFNFAVIFHFIFCLLQQVGLVGSFNRGEILDTLTQGRVSSTFNGAYELSAFLLLLFPFYLLGFVKEKKNRLSNFIYMSLIIYCIVLSDSRSSLVIAIIIIFMILHNEKVLKKIGTLKNFLIALPVSLPILLYFVPKINFSRFENLSFVKTFQIIKFTWKYKNFEKYVRLGDWYGDAPIGLVQMSNLGFDGSSYQRFSHWMQLIDGWLKSPFIGCGISVAGNSADGNYVKILTEAGIVGIVVWLYLLYQILKTLTQYKNYSWLFYSFISIVIGATFIDLFDSSKIMMMFWFLYGSYLRGKAVENKKYFNN